MKEFHPSANRATTRGRVYLGALVPWLALISHAQPSAPLVVLIGVPGSGRTEQAATLNRERHMFVISADDLVARNPQAFEKSRNSAIPGFDPRMDPAMNRLVEDALRSVDLSKGLVLAGYPASKDQADFLVSLREKLDLPKALVVHLLVSDNVARKQLKLEKFPDVDQQIMNYHRELDFARVYFPHADIHDIDANRSANEVAKDIRKLLPR